MKKLFASLAVTLALIAPLTVSAQTAPATPAPSGGSQTTVNATPANTQSTNSNAVANPLGQNTNVQVNNNNGGSIGWGQGMTCPVTALAVSGFNANQGIPNSPTTNTNGYTIGLNIPFNNRGVLSDCAQYGKLMVSRAALDNTMGKVNKCLDWAHQGADIHAGDLDAICHNVILAAPPPKPVSVAPAPVAPPAPVAVAPAPVATARPIHLSNFTPPRCYADPSRDNDLVTVNRFKRLDNPPAEYFVAYDRLVKAVGCNVDSRTIAKRYDGAGWNHR